MDQWQELIFPGFFDDYQSPVTQNKCRTTNQMFVNLHRAGQVDMSTALRLTNYLDKEREYVPWSSALGHLGFIGSMLSMRPSYGYYRVSYIKVKTPGTREGLSKHDRHA